MNSNNKRPRFSKTLVLASAVAASALALVLILTPGGESKDTPKPVALSQAMSQVHDGKIAKAELSDGTNKVTLTQTKAAGGRKLVADYPYAYSDTLTEELIKAKVTTKAVAPPKPNLFVGLLTSLLPILLLVGLLIWLTKSGALTGGIGKMTGNRGKQLGVVPDDRFSDVAGADEALNDMVELVDFLKDGDKFTKVGAKAPRGALLVGPPGTGKTLLARAVAGEAGVPFFALAGSDFVDTFVGVGAKRVRDLFDKAREAGSAIIFIDEIDAVGRARSSGASNGGDTERENTLISMLNEMDGFDTGHRIIVLAATNRADILDAALTRPGRLDRQIQVPSPDRRGRQAILAVHTKGKPIADDVDLEVLARRTPGMSGAELAQLVNEACMVAARSHKEHVDSDCFDDAVATVALGRARTTALVTDYDREITAWHEAGHTLAALLLEDADDPVQVSIIPRGPAGGVTWMSGNDDIFLSRAKALAGLRVCMGGRAAEEILLNGEYTQGAHGDLESATARAMAMVTKYGMSRLGYLVVDDDTVRMGGEVSVAVRTVAEELLQEAHRDATTLLRANEDLLRAVALELLDKENLNLAQVRAIRDRLRGDALAAPEQDAPAA